MLLETAPHPKPPLQGSHYEFQFQSQMQCYSGRLTNLKDKITDNYHFTDINTVP